jgi:2-polyprenyl-3-methyl-5-hydroxy-6-metoxy-1,4-benzoquinol methylase
MPLTDDDIRNAYRLILGREPEDERVVKLHSANFSSLRELRLEFLSSTEFRDQGFIAPPKAFSAFEPPEEIDIETDKNTLRAIFAKTAQYWSEIGKSAPYYSVVTEDRYNPSQFDQNEAAFWEGANDHDLIVALLRRIGRSPSDFRCCVEYGCGVGRNTVPLAGTFAEVIALDISQSHLKIAQRHVESSGAHNVRFLQVSPEDLMPAVDYDLWFSRLVLQHNAPPVTLEILDKAFARLPTNGVAIIHLPTYREGYSFNISEYLAGNRLGQEIEMHITPQKAILELACRNNCWLCEIHEEPGYRAYIVNIFVFQKKI